MKEITVKELKNKVDAGEVFILDVREPSEQYQSDIKYERKKLIPVGQLQKRLEELEDQKDTEIACLCRSGKRSAKAVELLEENGFKDVKNITGGINQWAKEIDPSLPVY